MLVLTRKVQQSIQIGPDITITILKVQGSAIRLGIEAPRNVNVLRSEVAEKLISVDDSPTVQSALRVTQREASRAAKPQPPVTVSDLPSITLVQYRGPKLGTRNRRRLMMMATGMTAPAGT